ncbi:MAG: hypothetical protein HFJ26_00915 [Clostridia bacterium]|nr:hypothetical protein [Clostridia bacterium]
MKKKIRFIVAFLVIVFIALIILIVLNYNLKETIVSDKDYLYEKVEQYLIRQEQPHYFLKTKNSEPNYNVNDFKVFTDITRLGIRQGNGNTYVYVWALIESYYVQDGELIHNSGSSMPYKFVFENDEIVDYENPQDGSKYTKSINRIFPKDIREKLHNIKVHQNTLRKQVKEHYSYLETNETDDNTMIKQIDIEIKDDREINTILD